MRSAASVLDLAAHLSRRSNILLAVAPKLRATPALKIDALNQRLRASRRGVESVSLNRRAVQGARV
jgi:hypothetical protein